MIAPGRASACHPQGDPSEPFEDEGRRIRRAGAHDGHGHRRFPGIDPLGHDFGHLWYSLFGFEGDPHWNPIHIASNVLIVAGFILLSSAWRVLYGAQSEGKLAVTGPYAYIRHPQYVAFIVIMFGFLLQWPTLVTLVMFPILVTVYVRLAYREEHEMEAELGDEYRRYAEVTPAFLPRHRTMQTA